jgi:hypothetical protein
LPQPAFIWRTARIVRMKPLGQRAAKIVHSGILPTSVADVN